MKWFKSIALVACLAAAAQAGSPREYSDDYLESRLAKFKRMRTTGLVLGLGGVGLIVLGSILVGTAEYETTTDFNGNEQRVTHDPQWPVGFLSIVGGVPLSITGIILGSIGSGKVSYYERRLQTSGLDFDLKPDRQAVALSWKF